MSEVDIEQLKYPIGKLKMIDQTTSEMRTSMIDNIRTFPQQIAGVVTELNDDQLHTPYRPGGWTVLQLVHHVADSHINSYIRFRWALTEDSPTIKAYVQEEWAKLPDANSAPVILSLNLLKAVHARWTYLLDRMTDEDFAKELSHPEWKKNLSLDDMLQLYNWHCQHHLAHITSLIHRKGW